MVYTDTFVFLATISSNIKDYASSWIFFYPGMQWHGDVRRVNGPAPALDLTIYMHSSSKLEWEWVSKRDWDDNCTSRSYITLYCA